MDLRLVRTCFQISLTFTPIAFIDAEHFSARDNGLYVNLQLAQYLGLMKKEKRGIKKSIAVAYSQTEYQHCIVHQVRNTLKYVAEKDKKEFASDLGVSIKPRQKKQDRHKLILIHRII